MTLCGTLLFYFLKELRRCGFPQQSWNIHRSSDLHNWRQKCRNFKLCVTNTTYLPQRHKGTQASESAAILQPCCWSSRTQVFCSSTLSKARYLRNLYSHLTSGKGTFFSWVATRWTNHSCWGSNSIFELYAGPCLYLFLRATFLFCFFKYCILL